MQSLRGGVQSVQSLCGGLQSVRGGLQSVQSLCGRLQSVRGRLQSVQPLRRRRRIGQSEMCGAALANSVGLQSLRGREGVQSVQPLRRLQPLCGGSLQSVQPLCSSLQPLQSLCGGGV